MFLCAVKAGLKFSPFLTQFLKIDSFIRILPIEFLNNFFTSFVLFAPFLCRVAGTVAVKPAKPAVAATLHVTVAHSANIKTGRNITTSVDRLYRPSHKGRHQQSAPPQHQIVEPGAPSTPHQQLLLGQIPLELQAP